MDTYQAIYDAVRSRISGFNACDLIDSITRQFDISHQMSIIQQEFCCTAYEMQRPSVLFKPEIGQDGNQWFALYGDNIQSGIAGFGDTVGKAMLDFDKNWNSFKAIGLIKAPS